MPVSNKPNLIGGKGAMSTVTENFPRDVPLNKQMDDRRGTQFSNTGLSKINLRSKDATGNHNNKGKPMGKMGGPISGLMSNVKMATGMAGGNPLHYQTHKEGKSVPHRGKCKKSKQRSHKCA